MNVRTAFFILLLAIAAIFLGRWYFLFKPTAGSNIKPSTKVEPTMFPTPSPLPDTVVGQLLLMPLDLSEKESTQAARIAFLKEQRLAGVTIFGDAISSASAERVQAQLKSVSNTLMIAVDHEGGSVQRYRGAGFTKLPSWRSQCQLSSSERRALLKKSAEELHAYGVTVTFAPSLDLSEGTSILGTRSCSSDPLLTAEAARDYMSVFSAEKILPVLKHYPGIGNATVDLHTNLDALSQTPPELALFESLTAFVPAPGVMTAHILVKNIAEDAPCTLSPICLATLQKTAPKSLIFTDALEMPSARYNIKNPKEPLSLAHVAIQAIYAGNHVLVFGKGVTPEDLESVLETLKKEYTESELFREKVLEAFAKIRTVQSI